MNLMEKNTTSKLLYTLKHSQIDAHFSKNSSDFVVREKALYEFSGGGEHLILHICKKDLNTNDALRILSEHTGVKIRDFGYAGLKDKQGLTFQYLSMPKKYEKDISNFSHPKLTILESFTHNNKLKIGHLKGNSFFIRLKKVSKLNALKLEQVLINIEKQGFANYFGIQRFGKFADNYKEGLELLQGKRKIKNPKIKNFLLSAFQSELFNQYLSKRIELSHFAAEFSPYEFATMYQLSKEEAKTLQKQKHFFKLLPNEVLGHYPYGKCFLCENMQKEEDRFLKRELSPMGLLLGYKAYETGKGFALQQENEIFKESWKFASQMQGSRRFLWTYLENLHFHYDEEKAHFCIEFFLQKGSYATVVLEELLHTN
ncbi:tRNA pseudouridine(13) synthase TruD [Campylobacter sp. MIT 21-1685]|uniref:tRNA pseudouridine(13) synthase TruD n=1 Tax=unclassified Campylobacter TaxID=2593542 RepID=UPI00224B80F0|nr:MULTISPECIES: tRNA pseudouridine(13) synthase TruD [unclassified Campylobacter]MCX2683232.1 tRNA pseudouridine(13) synthase TruD [Campylobacter sp. MIT 21-1684]MCX2751575.1 tRNA pseudouridine(13) synthase TruD [Campylobacter sp. MIT 21-1682]MCX2807774.1 tRNA pseudouridine(13) synthase TruD [Campylobacter sp. MIT 21-1685]